MLFTRLVFATCVACALLAIMVSTMGCASVSVQGVRMRTGESAFIVALAAGLALAASKRGKAHDDGLICAAPHICAIRNDFPPERGP